MNIKKNTILALILLSFLTSACGMKRSLTLPPKDGKKKKINLEVHLRLE